MPPLRRYYVFICHDWEYSGEYHRIRELLSTARNFDWENLSVPEHDPLDSDDMLKRNLRDQIRPASAMIVLAGMYTVRSVWMRWEMAFARRIGLSIIGVVPWGSRVVPRVVQDSSRELVGWRQRSIVEAIRRHSR
ncbi:MAG: TIR domain-containing protein [Phycisphaerae bacterium]|jgi:hypothetical protein|nr:TIR domain-containing protein [Phycisphaerae bacterium]